MLICADASGQNIPAAPAQGAFVVLASPQTRGAALAAAGIERVGSHPAPGAAEGKNATRYDSFEHYDHLVILLRDLAGPAAPPSAKPALLEGYLAAQRLVLVLPVGPSFAPLWQALSALDEAKASPAHVLGMALSQLLAGDAAMLEAMEDEIELLEEQAVKPHPKDCTAAIIALRKHLLALHRYYEALFDALEDLQENASELFHKAELRAFGLQKNKVDRLKNSVGHLREYLTQVREAYQNQLDISLNETMRVFTVITAVFLPLTLIVGWYGMNLDMPEYLFPFTYPIVVVASVVIVLGCLWWFRKKKWF